MVTGNTVVIKPSEVTPLSTIRTVQLWAEQLDLPQGVVNLVTGGGDVGAELVSNPKTDYISFTGHRDTGKRIVAAAAQNLTQVGLELGGKAPAIVLADADLDVAVESLVGARFTSTSGQQCGCAERVLVERPVLDEFVDRYATAAVALKVGDPRAAGTDLGPLVNAAQFEKVSASVAGAREEGGTVVTGGGRPDEFDKGFYFAPTVITGVDRTMGIARDETFGPVMPVIPVDSLEEALEIGNESRYGLTGYLYTSSYATAMEAAEDLECGELFINRSVGEAMHAHHGGHKESGYGGGEDGKHGVLKFTQLKAVYHNW
jgi:lactaldehyde dehydrogenase/glycolaldehyde dehydrogenase